MTAGDFFAELKRRKVPRLALIYVIVGWAVIEAADTILPNLDVPGWAVSLIVVLVILGFPVALVLSWMFDFRDGGVKRAPVSNEESAAGGPARPPVSGARDAARSGPEPEGAPTADDERPESPPLHVPSEKSIAVLPFVNMSDDRENEYFSDGMTEEILNALAKVKPLQVASRTSCFAFKGHESDVLEIARKLRVATVVEGSVRKAGSRIRVTAQLISAEDGYHLWSETYDRELEDVFQVQDDIARSIVDALRVELVGEETQLLVEQETSDIDAYTAYLKGRFLFNRYQEQDLRRSLELYQDALDHDPRYGRAYAGMADTWMQLADDWVPPETAYPQAKAAAEKAVALDESLAEAHTAIGKVLGWFEWDFDGAELALRRAVAANPRYADAHWGLASILPSNGQLAEGIEEARTALGLDPLSPLFSYWLARFLYFKREYSGATEEAGRTSRPGPSWSWARRPKPLRSWTSSARATGTSAPSSWRPRGPPWATSTAPSTPSRRRMPTTRPGSSTSMWTRATMSCMTIPVSTPWSNGSGSGPGRGRSDGNPRPHRRCPRILHRESHRMRKPGDVRTGGVRRHERA